MIFESSDAALPAGDGSDEHIYVRHMKTRRVSLVDRNSKGKPANDSSYYASISGNGRFVGFDSVATNLPPGDAVRRAYVRDLRIGKTILVGRNSKGKPIDGESYYPHPSGTGRYVVFEGSGTNVPGGGVNQVYVRDLGKRRTKLLSRAAIGDPADTSSGTPSISLDGRFGVFGSLADNLPGDSSYRNVYRAGPIG